MTAVREYAVPLVLALLLHGGVAAALVRGWQPDGDDMPRLVEPRIIEASILVMEKPKARPPLPSALPEPARAPATKPPEPPPKPEPARPPRPDPDIERRAQEEAERQRRLRELAEQSTALAFEDEAADLDAATADEQTMTYAAAIKQAVIYQWSRPASARLGMTARFELVLLPSGEILNVRLLDSNGNAAFVRSAEAAIRKADPFEVPSDTDLFEEHFRRFTLLFDPQDLLR